MISKVMIKLRPKFQFQIPFEFYRTVQEVELAMVIVTVTAPQLTLDHYRGAKSLTHLNDCV